MLLNSHYSLTKANSAPPDAVLLVILPPLASHCEAPALAFTAASLAALQRQLGVSVRVLKIDEANFPAIVRSFAPVQLPVCVLVYQGVELWRQHSLPDASTIAATLLAQAKP